ncbi:MAG: hypothetical protein WAL38_05380 [Solirubrobacteraceae bacterium]
MPTHDLLAPLAVVRGERVQDFEMFLRGSGKPLLAHELGQSVEAGLPA